MKEAGLKYSGKIKFVNTLMHWPINHGVGSQKESPFLYPLSRT